jgi:hypothetical protein
LIPEFHWRDSNGVDRAGQLKFQSGEIAVAEIPAQPFQSVNEKPAGHPGANR